MKVFFFYLEHINHQQVGLIRQKRMWLEGIPIQTLSTRFRLYERRPGIYGNAIVQFEKRTSQKVATSIMSEALMLASKQLGR